jgi:hypothetical protein
MAIEWLLEAARDQLRTNLVSLVPGATAAAAKSYIDVQPDGHPPANMGEWYVALDELGATGAGQEQEYLEERYQIGVWITWRTARYAPDRYIDFLKDASRGLRPFTRAVIEYLHGKEAVRTAANTLGGLPDAAIGDAFQQPLWFLGQGKITGKSSDWIGRADGEDTFAVRQLRFAGGLRIQAHDVMG